MAVKHNVSKTAIYYVLGKKTFKDEAPEIPAVDFATHGMTELPDIAVQQIRATWDAYKETHQKKGLLAALGRKFSITKSHVRNIVEGVTRREVVPDATAVIPLSELEFLDLTQRGMKHKLAKLDDEQVLQILVRLDAGEPVMVLAKEYGVSIQIIYKIKKGETRPGIFANYQAQKGLVDPIVGQSDSEEEKS